MKPELEDINFKNVNEIGVSLKIEKRLVKLIDNERSKFRSPRSSWIIQAIVEKLERLGHEIE